MQEPVHFCVPNFSKQNIFYKYEYDVPTTKTFIGSNNIKSNLQKIVIWGVKKMCDISYFENNSISLIAF